jgi:hypothetical protein
VEKLVTILERSVKELRNKKILIVKILWEHHGTQDSTWETEEISRVTVRYVARISRRNFLKRGRM